MAARVLKKMGGSAGRIANLPGGAAWSGLRDLPAPQGQTFLELWQARQK